MGDYLLDKLLDENNEEDIILYDENNVECEFEQVAVIPYNEKIYAILKPLTETEGIADDEVIVFSVELDAEGEGYLVVEKDDALADAVFNEYNKLLDELD